MRKNYVNFKKNIKKCFFIRNIHILQAEIRINSRY
nr:MAG TPA: hypothetical protein [Caudoviricetes sp.]